jgi:hypothetical protein
MIKEYKYLIGLRFTIYNRNFPTSNYYWFENIDVENKIMICWVNYDKVKDGTVYDIDQVLDNINNDIWVILPLDLRKLKLKQLKNEL